MTNVTTTTSSSSTSRTTSTISSVYTGPTEPARIGNYSYIGCWTDNVQGRVLKNIFLYGTSTNLMTLEKCNAFCNKYTYWGVEYGMFPIFHNH